MGPTTADKQQTAEALANRLRGSCQSMPAEFEDDMDVLDHLEELIFLCPCCGWWCDVDELNETGPNSEDICDDCVLDNEQGP